MKSMMFAFRLQNRSDLERLLSDQQDPKSPNYHHWLTPQEFGKRFGVSEQEYQGAVQWFQQHGFAVRTQPGNHLRIYFEGAVGDVERAFNVTIGMYEYGGKTYYSNDTDPVIPAGLQGKAHGVYGLDNFPKAHPMFRTGNGIALAPLDMHLAYNMAALDQGGIDGSGQRVAVVETSDFNISDVQLFRNTFGLPPNDPQKFFVSANPGIDATGGEEEALLDVEWAGAIAKGAVIEAVIADNSDIQSALDYILNQLFSTRVIAVSFGNGESSLQAGQAQQFMDYMDSYFMQAAAQGQTVLVASGDEGAQQSVGTSGLSRSADINYLCSSGFVVCVGATSLNLKWDNSGNATQYVSETAWNNGLPLPKFAASGGGRSAYISKPAYQAGPGVPADGQRDVPDVAVVGDPDGPGVLIVRGGTIVNNTYGGTSLSAPVWAGVFALVNQFGSPAGVGWANPRLYQLGTAQQQSSSSPQAFHDVTAGNNTTPTVTGFNAGLGFDLVTGWGSFNGDVFVRNFAAQPSPPQLVALDHNPSYSGTIPAGSSSGSQCTLNSTQYTISVPTGSTQLIVTLDGPSGGDVDLYVRKGEPVGGAGFSNPFIADYASQGDTPHERVYVGPNSHLPLSAGTYYIGVSNCAAAVASFALTANVMTPASPVKIEELAVDNGNPEDFLNPNGETSFPPNGANGVIVVNRLTPLHYPSELTGIRIYFEIAGNDPQGKPIDPTGQSLRLVAFSDPSGSGVPPAAPVFQVDQLVTIPGVGGFADFSIANPPVIQSGDWYVGVQQPTSFNGFLVSVNESGFPKRAGFISTNNGASFTGPYQQPNTSPPPAQLNANFLMRGVAQSQASLSGPLTLHVPALGSSTATINVTSPQLTAGYAVASTSAGYAPVGTAVISYAQNGIVLTEVGVPSSPPTTHARVFIDFRTAVAVQNSSGTINIDTGVALVNGGTAPANLSLTLLDSAGTTTVASGSGTLAAGAHVAQFVDQLGSIAPGFAITKDFSMATRFGTLDIVSDQPISVLALRLTLNQRGDALLTSTPIADLSQALGSRPLYFPQFVDGGGYTTMAILVNTSDAVESGKLQLYRDDGSPFKIQPVGGTQASLFPYSISPGGVFVLETDGSPPATISGWAQIIPDSGTGTPAGAGVFSFSQGGILVTQSGIPSATPTTHARVYVDTTGQHNTGLAIADPQGTALNVSVTAFQSDGITRAGSGSAALLPHGHKAAFAGQLISGLPSGFAGVLDISAPQPFVALTLRSLQNSRGDFLLTTMPTADLNQKPTSPLVFPQIVDNGGYQTQIVLLSTAGSSTVTLSFLGNDGKPIK